MNSPSRDNPKSGLAATIAVALLLASGCAGYSAPVVAEQRLLLEGILDGELYETDANSYSLARNNGDVSSLGRLQLWSAWQVSPGWQVYALGEAESDDAQGKTETNSEVNQLALRYSSNSSPFYFVEAGKILPPIAIASARHLSTQNPLIGTLLESNRIDFCFF